MLTIEGINKLTITTLSLGDKNKEYQDWSIENIIPHNEYYKIKLKCIRCSPASPILGSEMEIFLYRERSEYAGVKNCGYQLYCPALSITTYISPEDMKVHGVFINTLLKLIDNKLVSYPFKQMATI